MSPAGELSFAPYLETQASTSEPLEETYRVVHTFLPDYANDDGSYDLFLGQPISAPDTDCRLVENFVPPRRHVLDRTLNVLSSGVGGVSVSGTKPGATPYSAICTDAQSVTLTASPGQYIFIEWQDEDGNVLGAGESLQMEMDVDRSVTAAVAPIVPDEEFAAYMERIYGLTGPDATPLADPDGDGVLNILELFYNTNPARIDGRKAQFSSATDGDEFSLVYREPKTIAGLSIVFERSTDMLDFSGNGLTYTILEDHPAYRLMRVSFPRAGTTTGFLRAIARLSTTP